MQKKYTCMKNNLFSQLTYTENPQGVIAVAKISDKRNELNGEFYLLCDKLRIQET